VTVLCSVHGLQQWTNYCVVCMCVLHADDLLKLLNDFYRRTEVKRLAAENGLDGKRY